MNRHGPILALAAFLTAAGVWADHDPAPVPDPIPGPIPYGPFTVELQDVVSDLIYPVDVESPRDGSGRLFVTLRQGLVVILDNGVPLPTPFLDISASTVINTGSAMSSIAFHPQFAEIGSPGEGKFYTISQEAAGTAPADFGDPVDAAHQSVVYEWRVSASDPNLTDPASRREVLRIDESTTVHNLNDMVFGPDGLLYLTKGDDDATAADSLDGTTIHGSLLRIDVDNGGMSGYSLPPDNPFLADPAGRLPPILAYGFRNPWRLSFDRNNGMLYVGDIGEDDIEEIDEIEPGRYYGWNDKEGSFAFLDFNGVTDDLTDLPPDFDGVDPIAEYDHSEGDRSLTGGFVYRGSAIPELIGQYVFGDWSSGGLFHVAPNEGVVRRLAVDPAGDQPTNTLIGFGEDEDGELLFTIAPLDFSATGRVVRIVGLSSSPPMAPPAVPDGTGGAALRVAKLDVAGSRLALEWDTTACTESRGYHVLYGGSADLPSPPRAAFELGGAVCNVGVTSPFHWDDVPDPAADPNGLLWWIIIAHDARGNEGSWGLDDSGADRIGPLPDGASGECGITARDLSNGCGR